MKTLLTLFLLSTILCNCGISTEYLNNAFIWDPKCFVTIWHLIRRPGFLTKEFNAGKFISQEHPLKLNMFFLLIFVTMFVFFGSEDKMTNSVDNLTENEQIYSSLQLQTLIEDTIYAKKIQESPRDTILLQAPLILATNFPQVISNLETKEDTGGKSLDKWIVQSAEITRT